MGEDRLLETGLSVMIKEVTPSDVPSPVSR